MKYNLFFKTKSGTFNILDADEEILEKILDVYKHGKDTLFIKGKKYWFSDLFEIQIYTFEHDEITSGEDLMRICEKQDLVSNGYLGIGKWLSKDILIKVGDLVTDKYITNDFGYLKDVRLDIKILENYVEPQRIDEIENLNGDDFNYTKLIRILKELNVAYSNSLFFTIPPLVRAIIDHIPPIFGKETFAEVSGNGTRSFRDNMNNLNKSSRKIADAFLHTHIRKKEALPNKTQINFKNDLDVLLQEIVRLNK